MVGTFAMKAMVVCSATPVPAPKSNKSAKASQVPKESKVSKVRAHVEARLTKLQASREVMEERRRKQLWSIAKVLDEIAREEAQRGGGEDSGDATEVRVTFIDSLDTDTDSSGTDDDFTWAGPRV